jgi:methionyl aminopeptidase
MLRFKSMSSPRLLKAPEADAAYTSAQKVVETHRRLSSWLRPGQTLAQIDAFVAKTLEDLNCRSAFWGYRTGNHAPFPSYACLSVNNCVVHGTAGYYREPMKQGDVLKIDIGVVHRGWIGDAAWTYIYGQPTPAVARLAECGKESLRRGVAQLRPGNKFIEFARAVQGYVEDECGYHLIRGLGGHGYGQTLHAAPFVSNTLPTYSGEWPDAHTPCTPGILIAVEPMIAVGTGLTVQNPGIGRRVEWPVFTKDGSLSVHYEHDVLITENGPRILTEGLEEIRDIIG